MGNGEREPLLFIPTVRSPNTALVTMETTKEEAGWSFPPGMILTSIVHVMLDELAGAV